MDPPVLADLKLGSEIWKRCLWTNGKVSTHRCSVDSGLEATSGNQQLPGARRPFYKTQAFIIHTGKMLLSWSGSCCFLHLTHKLEASLWDLRKPVIWKTIKKMERKNVLLEERGSDSAVVDLCWLFQSLPWPDVQSLPRFMFESLCWWFMFTGKERRPTLEPCGTPHVTPPDLPASAPVLRLLKGGKKWDENLHWRFFLFFLLLTD